MNDAPVWFLTHEFTPFHGGAATYVREVARAARDLGVDARVLAPSYGKRSVPSKPRDGVFRFPGRGKLGPLGVTEMAAGIWQHRRALAGAPVIAGSAGALMALILLDRAGLFRPHRLLCFLHGSEILKLRRRPFWQALTPAFFRRWPHVAVASGFVRNLWQTAFAKVRTSLVHLAPCACSEAFLADATHPASRAPRQPGVDDPLDVLTLARLHPRKGQVHVARALGRLPADLRRRVRYLVAGTGSEAYRSEIRSACLASDVHLVGLPPVADRELASVYRRAAVYAQASVSLPESVEGFGISYLEAAACGLPVAAWDSGGTSEAVLHEVTGLLAPEGDVDALAGILHRLLLHADLRDRLGLAGREHALGFRWEQSARVLTAAAAAAYPRR